MNIPHQHLLLLLASTLAMESATASHDAKMLQRLQNNQLDPLKKQQEVFREAVEHGYLESAKFILDNYGINLGYNKNQYLNAAVEQGDAEMVRLFLQRPEILLDNLSPDSFFEACAKGAVVVVRALLDREDFALTQTEMSRALAFAVQYNQYEVAKILLMDGRADPNWKYYHILQMAIGNRNMRIAKLILADPRVEVKDVIETMDRAILNMDNPVCEMIRMYGKAIDAAKYGLLPSIQAITSFDPEFIDVVFYSACWAGKHAIVDYFLLMKHNIGPIITTEAERNLALELAIHSGKAEVVKSLLADEQVQNTLTRTQLDDILSRVDNIQRNELFLQLFDWLVSKDATLKELKGIRMEMGKSGMKKGRHAAATRKYQKRGLPHVAKLVNVVAQPVYH